MCTVFSHISERSLALTPVNVWVILWITSFTYMYMFLQYCLHYKLMLVCTWNVCKSIKMGLSRNYMFYSCLMYFVSTCIKCIKQCKFMQLGLDSLKLHRRKIPQKYCMLFIIFLFMHCRMLVLKSLKKVPLSLVTTLRWVHHSPTEFMRN